MKKLVSSLLPVALLAALALSSPVIAQEVEGEGEHAAAEEDHGGTPHYPLREPKHVDWSFAGPFGTYNQAQLQRGLKVYTQVCAACHSLDRVAFRTLEDMGYSEAQVRSFASEYEVQDGPDDSGEMFMRTASASDTFPAPFPNEEAAAAAMGGAVPPDFSLLAKARAPERGFPTFIFDIFTMYAENGPDYIYSLLTGYPEEVPADVEVPQGTYYNPYYIAGPALAMAPPLSDGIVTYSDGSPETVEQYAKDVAAFMMWAAEPHLDERKQLGFRVMIFLLIFATLLYFTKKSVWRNVEH